MFRNPREVLAAGEGSLAEAPLPLLLHSLFAEGRTATLELRLRGLEKRIRFEDGSPVACRSNLLHETLGRYLVEKGKLTEDEHQEALRESVESGRKMGEVLVGRGRLAPFDLYKLMQANLAVRILDAFRWADARWRLLDESEPAELALRMNPAQLVLTGCARFLPFEVVASQLAFTDEQRFALSPSPRHFLEDLRLSPQEAKLARVLRRRPTFEEAARESGLDVEQAMRRLYALAVLGLVEFTDEGPALPAAGAVAAAARHAAAAPAGVTSSADDLAGGSAGASAAAGPPVAASSAAAAGASTASVAAASQPAPDTVLPATAPRASTPASPPPPATAPSAAAGLPGAPASTPAGADAAAAPGAPSPPGSAHPASGAPPAPEAAPPPTESDALRDALASDWLDHRAKDPFDLLGVPEAASATELRRAFLAHADRFSPLRFGSPDLREKAEALLAARARAYGALADPDQAALWRKRRAAAAEKTRGAGRPSTAEQFRISTTLLDATSQFAEGRRRLEAGNPRGALEQFQYAADIEPRPSYRAHLAWARYLVDPARHARLALSELAEIAREEPGCADAHRFAGEIHRAAGALGDAEEGFRRAQRADPSDRRAAELALETMRLRKARG